MKVNLQSMKTEIKQQVSVGHESGLTLPGRELRSNTLGRDMRAKNFELTKAKKEAIMQNILEDIQALLQTFLVVQIAWQDIIQ